MNTTPALEWLDATFDTRRRKAFDHAFRNRGPMFTLKSAMDVARRCAYALATTTTL
jgi:hypothetical protein